MTGFHTVTEYAPPERTWILNGVLMPDVVNLVIGQPKVGKSQLVAGLVATLATGQPLNGCPEIAPEGPHKTLWIGTDGGAKSEAKSRLSLYGPEVTDMVLMADSEHPSDERLIYSESGDPDLVNRSWLGIAETAHNQHGVSVMVIDHLQGILGDRGTSADKSVAPFLNTLNRIGGIGMTVILVHHVSNKSFGNQEGLPMGHTLIEASARCIVDLRKVRKGTQEAFIRTNLTPENCLRIHPLNGAPLSVDWFGQSVDRPRAIPDGNPTKRNRKVSEDQRRIARAKAILDAPAPVRKTQTSAGSFLEGRPDLMAGATNGRQAVVLLIKCRLLATDEGGRIVPGEAWKSDMAAGSCPSVA